MRAVVVLALVLAFSLLPLVALGAGAHEGLNCVGCHGIHNAKGEIIFAVEPNKKALNPRTKQPYTGVTALCLGCHETMDKGGLGILPVSVAMSHPFGVKPNPKVAVVPQEFLREGKLECVGCHDPHPSNPNYKYLRVDTKGGAKMEAFCALCHPAKGEVKPTGLKVFSSMDERKFAAPKPKAPAKRPVRKR
jgi:predicted CXXCH cytochrome family protein